MPLCAQFNINIVLKVRISVCIRIICVYWKRSFKQIRFELSMGSTSPILSFLFSFFRCCLADACLASVRARYAMWPSDVDGMVVVCTIEAMRLLPIVNHLITSGLSP